MVPVYAVNCDEEENKPLCGMQGVKGFPTVKVSTILTRGASKLMLLGSFILEETNLAQ